ncbi:MAG: hypothetical protein ACRDYX_17690, partial [Egibacteraceae bacterium]
MSRSSLEELVEHFIEPQAVLDAYAALWDPDAPPVLCIDGLSGNGKSRLLDYLHILHDPGRLRVLLDLDDLRLAEGHRWLDDLGKELARQVATIDLAAYWGTADELDRERAQIKPAAPQVRQQQGAWLKGRIEGSPQTVHVDLSPAVAEANERKAKHDRTARKQLTKALFDALEPLAGREWVLLVDTYERVAHLADAEFRAWLEREFLDTLARRQPRARVVIAGREGLPEGGHCIPAPPLTDWDKAASDRFLAGWRAVDPMLRQRVIDPTLRQAIYDHCQGHPLVTDLARQVWKAGIESGQPLKAADLRPHTNQRAAIEWLLDKFAERLPAGLKEAVRAAALLRDLSHEALNALLPDELADDLYRRLRGLSFVGRPPAPVRVHDLIRQVEDSYRRREKPDEYRRLHAAAFDYFAARNDVLNGLYHLLALDDEVARAEWITAIDQARLSLDLDAQSQLLGLLQMPERQTWLQPHTRAFHSLFTGLLAHYQ